MNNSRQSQILRLKESNNRNEFAKLLATHTNFSIQDVKKILSAAPFERNERGATVESDGDEAATNSLLSLAKSLGVKGFTDPDK